MTEMGEVAVSGRNGRGGLHGLGDRHVRGMRPLAEGIEHKDINPARGLDGLRGDLGAIGEIGQQFPSSPKKDIAGRGEFPVRQVDRDDLGLPESERASDDLRGEAKVVLPGLRFIEGVPEGVP
jgi:hypothetical protein